jgi:hypothetical protein
MRIAAGYLGSDYRCAKDFNAFILFLIALDADYLNFREKN